MPLINNTSLKLDQIPDLSNLQAKIYPMSKTQTHLMVLNRELSKEWFGVVSKDGLFVRSRIYYNNQMRLSQLILDCRLDKDMAHIRFIPSVSLIFELVTPMVIYIALHFFILLPRVAEFIGVIIVILSLLFSLVVVSREEDLLRLKFWELMSLEQRDKRH